MEGNKNKVGSLDGMNIQGRNGLKMNFDLRSCMSAEVCDQVMTEKLNPILDGNCDHNIAQFTEYGDNDTDTISQPTHINFTTN